MVTIGQQHVVQCPLEARFCSALEEDVVGKGPMHVCQQKQRLDVGVTCYIQAYGMQGLESEGHSYPSSNHFLIAPWRQSAVQVINSSPSILADGTQTKLRSF